MRYLMIAAALCTGMVGAQAQTTPAEKPATATQKPMQHPAHNCMMTSDADWTSLGLTAEQTTSVQAIQAECKKECAGKMKDDPSMMKMMDTHEARVKEVLTPAQYESWMKLCSAQAAPAKTTAPEKKDKM